MYIIIAGIDNPQKELTIENLINHLELKNPSIDIQRIDKPLATYTDFNTLSDQTKFDYIEASTIADRQSIKIQTTSYFDGYVELYTTEQYPKNIFYDERNFLRFLPQDSIYLIQLDVFPELLTNDANEIHALQEKRFRYLDTLYLTSIPNKFVINLNDNKSEIYENTNLVLSSIITFLSLKNFKFKL